MKRRYVVVGLLLILLDAVGSGLAFYAAYILRLRTEYPLPVKVPAFDAYVPMMLIQIGAMLLSFAFMRLYIARPGASRIDELNSIFSGASVGTLLSLAVTSFVLKNLDFPRLMIPYAWGLTFVFVGLARLGLRVAISFVRRHGAAVERVVIIGAGRVGSNLMETIKRSPQLGYTVVGFLDNDPEITGVDGVPVLGTSDDLPDVLERNHIDDVLIALPHAPHQDVLDIVSRCERAKVNIRVFPDLFQIMATEVSINDLNGVPLITVRDAALRGWRLTLKRVVDLILGAIILILISPFLLLFAILIKLESRGPAFYVQERVGLDGLPFLCIKFRTMWADAEAETGPIWATADDPRRTRIGRLLRRFSLDEFPQFMNVLLGDMSIVGPRPERPEFVEQFRQEIPRYMERHREKAGITGWAQINGLRGSTSIEERTRYDVWYVENWSLWLDIKIMIRTVFEMVRGRNAY
jgi:exopolysaccharide biosynthesis polyprenyl glycosylphosphotransferase